MTEFKNVTLTKKANVYFDGKVTSRVIMLEDGSKKTLGIMLPGDYEFGTASPELMEITAGTAEVQLPDNEDWLTVSGGGSFNVPGESRFKIRVSEVVDYCCSYL